MISSLLFVINTSVLFTPLEQFDNVRWFASRTFERIEPYALFVAPAEWSTAERYATVSSSPFNFRLSPLTGALLLVAALAVRPLLSRLSALPAFAAASALAFSPLALLATIHVLTGGFATA